MQFTEKYIQSLKPKTIRYETREGNGSGFAIRVSVSGEKTWTFFYTFDGKKRRMTLGNYPALTLADARKKHRQALKTLENGKDPSSEKQKAIFESRNALTIEELIEEFLTKWCIPRKRSWQEDQRILYKDIKPAWGKVKAKEINKRDVINLLENIHARNAPIAANRTLACIRRMFNFGVERDIISVSPCISIKALAKENRRDRCLSTQEIKYFWHGLNGSSMSEHSKLALKLQLITAQRKGEIVSMEWNDIDITNGWWVIPAEKAKNGHTHRVPLCNLALEVICALKKLNNNSQWVFPSHKEERHITGDSLSKAIRRNISKLTETVSIVPHDLRRTAASHMTSMGISRLVISKILNHVDKGVTAIYDRHAYDNEKRHALEVWNSQLKEIIFDSQIKSNVVNLR